MQHSIRAGRSPIRQSNHQPQCSDGTRLELSELHFLVGELAFTLFYCLPTSQVLRHHTLEAIRDQSSNIEGSSVIRIASRYHFNTLKEIRLNNCGHIVGEIVQEVPSMCTALEHFVISGSRVLTRFKYLVENKWVCARLKHWK